MAWYWWALLINCLIGAVLYIVGKLQHRVEFNAMAALVVTIGWLPLVVYTAYEDNRRRRERRAHARPKRIIR